MGIQFADIGDDVVPMAGNASSLNLVFHEGVQFFHDVQGIHFFGKGADFFHGKGIRKADFQDRYAVAEDFLDIVVPGAGCDDADTRITRFFYIPGAGFRPFLQFFLPLFNDATAHAATAGTESISPVRRA